MNGVGAPSFDARVLLWKLRTLQRRMADRAGTVALRRPPAMTAGAGKTVVVAAAAGMTTVVVVAAAAGDDCRGGGDDRVYGAPFPAVFPVFLPGAVRSASFLCSRRSCRSRDRPRDGPYRRIEPLR